MKQTCVAFSLFISGLIVSCTADKGAIPVPVINSCDTINATWSTHIQPIITNNCSTVPGCHVQGFAAGDLTTYSGVKAKVDNGTLEQQVLVDKTMPPSGPLSEDDRKKIECWIRAGAPNN